MRYLYYIVFILLLLTVTAITVSILENHPLLFSYQRILLLILLIFFGGFLFIAKRLFTAGYQFRYLARFWGFIFGELPVQPGKTYDPVAHLLIVYEHTEEIFSYICEIDEVYNKSEGIKIKAFKVDVNQDESIGKKVLRFELDSAQAIVICRSSLIEENHWIYDSIEDWANESSEYPILVVDFLSDQEELELKVQEKLSEIPYKYDFTKLTQPYELPWRFLSRSNERGHLWKEQALANRRVSFYNLLIASVFVLGTFLLFQNETEKKNELAERMAKASSAGLEYVLRKNATPHTDMQSYLCKYADIQLYALLENNGIDFRNTLYEVSLWSTAFVDSASIAYQVGWSNRKREMDTYDLFELEQKSIVSCAYENPNKVIYWNRYDEGAVSVYPVESLIDGEGKLKKNQDGQMIIELEDEMVCNYYKQESSLHNAVVCFHYDDTISPEVENAAICISSKDSNNAFFKSSDTALFLREIAQAIASINKKSIEPDDLSERYEKKVDEDS